MRTTDRPTICPNTETKIHERTTGEEDEKEKKNRRKAYARNKNFIHKNISLSSAQFEFHNERIRIAYYVLCVTTSTTVHCIVYTDLQSTQLYSIRCVSMTTMTTTTTPAMMIIITNRMYYYYVFALRPTA